MARRPLAAVILAAGQGTRMKSDRPKVAFEVCGWPMVRHVVEAARAVRAERIVVVVGHGRSDDVAVANALALAARHLDTGVNESIVLGVAEARDAGAAR